MYKYSFTNSQVYKNYLQNDKLIKNHLQIHQDK